MSRSTTDRSIFDIKHNGGRDTLLFVFLFPQKYVVTFAILPHRCYEIEAHQLIPPILYSKACVLSLSGVYIRNYFEWIFSLTFFRVVGPLRLLSHQDSFNGWKGGVDVVCVFICRPR